jgi:hypothetical protein
VCSVLAMPSFRVAVMETDVICGFVEMEAATASLESIKTSKDGAPPAAKVELVILHTCIDP